MDNDSMNQNQINQPQKSSMSTMMLVAILMLLIGGGIGYYVTKTYYPKTETVTVEVPAIEEETPSTSTETTDTTADWKTYENDSFGLTFKYPETYKITDERDFHAGKVGGLTLTDNTRAGNPTINLIVPDGRGGPQPTDIVYKTSIVNGKITIDSRTVLEKNEGNDDNNTYIELEIGKLYNDQNGNPYSQLTATSGNGILIWMHYNLSTDYEDEFKEIINTIEISKPDIYGKP